VTRAALDTPPALIRRTVKDDEHDPYLEFLEWVFGGVGETFPPMSPERRLDWMRCQLPKTYARLSLSRRWPTAL